MTCDGNNLNLYYTIDDDGIHAGCPDCGFDKNLGFGPWLYEVQQAQDEHEAQNDPGE